MKKILIIGSNFGSKTYLNSFLTLKEKFHIYICSPNIFKKQIQILLNIDHIKLY